MMGSTTNFLKTSSRLSSEDIVSLITYQVSLLKNRLTVHNGSIELRCLSFHDMKMKESEKVTPYTMSVDINNEHMLSIGMRFLTIRNLSIFAFLLLVAWELRKAIIALRLRHIMVQQIRTVVRKLEFDEYSLTNEHLLTNNLADVEYAAIQRIRKKALSTSCHQRSLKEIYPQNTDMNKGINPTAFRNILVSDKHQLLYCTTPKVASTNWKRVLLVLDGYFTDPKNITASLAHDFNTGYFRRLSDYTPDEINLRLTTYYKFLFARHPFERLVSAFKNKFVSRNRKSQFFRVIFGRYIMRKYRDRRNITSDEYKTGNSVTFDEFLRYIVDSPVGDADFWNEHWERIDRLCLPCLIQYDFIGKFETLRQDADYLLRTLDVADIVEFPAGYYSGKSLQTGQLMNEYFKSVPTSIMEKLYDLYKIDFLLFGYDQQFMVKQEQQRQQHSLVDKK